MIGDAIACTHNGTGGTGTLTLAAVTGFPQPTDLLTTSGTRLIWYEAAEYTDSTLVTLSKYEKGIGSLVLSTNVLTRSTILTTWTSGGSYNNSNGTALSFGNTAANIRIFIGASASTQKLGPPLIQNLGGDTWAPFNTRLTYTSAAAPRTISTGNNNYFLIEYIGSGLISQVAVDCTTAVAASTARVALYDILPATGGPGNLIKEFTSGGTIDTSATGFRAITLATPFQLPQGFYWMGFGASSGTLQFNCLDLQGNGLQSSGSGRDITHSDKGVTYGAFPATGPTSWANSYTKSSGGQWGVFYK